MAKVKPAKSGGKLPITRHPLFPATVALWFGALFGVGSLAIRPSLIEGLIVSFAIDAIIPSAAPPLGATTRILLALTLAALGGTLGAWLARRIARPKPVHVQRKRSAASAEARSPAGALAAGSRRGRLALSEEGRPRRDYVDHAPLPGGATILDVSQFDLDGFEADEPERIETIEPVQEYRPVAAAEPAQWSPEPEARKLPTDAQVFQPIASEPQRAEEPAGSLVQAETFVREDVQEVAPQAAAPAAVETFGYEVAPPFSRPSSQNADTVPEMHQNGPAPFAPQIEPAPFAPPVDRAPFSAPDIREPAQAQDTLSHAAQFQPAGSPDRAEMEPLARLGGETEDRYDPLPPKVRPGSIFEQKPAAGLFTQPHSTQVSHLGWDTGLPRAPAMQAQVAPPSEPAHAVDPVAQPAEPETAPLQPVAAERIAGAPLDDLSQVELLERLALSMRRKRAAAAVPEAREAPAPSAPGLDAADEAFAAPAPPPVPIIPASLRPIGLDEEDDGDHLPGFVPPRHFGQAQNDSGSLPAAAASEPVAAAFASAFPAQEDQGEPQAADPVETSESSDLDEGYSSLLSLSRPGTGQQRFIRIEEPVNHSAEIEPVVIFPGKEPVSGEGPFARHAAAPGAEGTGQVGERGARDPQETDRALRTALANIQRMSGAA